MGGLLGGCGDDISCIFTNGCMMGSGDGEGSSGARLPGEGEWIADGSPQVLSVFPEGDIVASTTPIVIVFNESMNPDALVGAFELIPIISGLAGMPIPIPTTVLVGDGRMLVLLPLAPLIPAEYLVVVSDDADIRDITGQVTILDGGTQVGSFGVDVTDPTDIQVIAVYPTDVSSNESETGQIVVVFDRAAVDSSVNSDSIQVTIDGAEPNSDPEPEALMIQTAGVSFPDNRAYTWRSVTPAGDLDPLPQGGQVLLEISRVGFEIVDVTGATVLPLVSSYTLNDFARPLSAAILSQPTDAIGTANLMPGDPEELLIQIDLMGAEEGDILDLFLFGTSLEVNPRTIALSRELDLTDPSPIDVAFYGLEELDLTLSLNPVTSRLADGPVSFAFRLRRGSASTSLRVLDVDTVNAGIQDPILDTSGPVVLEFFYANAGATEIRSDLRDIVVGGRADELVRAAEVSSVSLGDNGVLPDVIGIDDNGLFVAKSISVGILPPGNIQLDLVTYDAALNPSDPVSLSFRQVGAVGPGAFTPGDVVSVEVFDSITLQPIEGALVVTHGDEGNGLDYPLVDSVLTDEFGMATLMTAGAPSIEAIVTVDAMGYDLFSFHGITSGRLSLPLKLIGNEASATVDGAVTSSDLGFTFLVNLFERRVGDSRRPEGAFPFYVVDTCVSDPFGTGETSCPYGPEPMRPGLVGVQTFLAGNFLYDDEDSFLVDSLVAAFDIRFPLDVLSPGDISTTGFNVAGLLSAGPVEERPLELTRPFGGTLDLFATGIGGIDLGAGLIGDPTTTGDPFVTVEAVAPGFPGTFPVGLGAAYVTGTSTWRLRAGFGGAVSPGGFFGSNGLVDTDLFLRVELRDSDGNRIGTRPRTSRLDILPLFDQLIPVGAVELDLPLPGGNTMGQGFNLEFLETLVDFYAQLGFYRADLEDEGGRRWRIWRLDRPGLGQSLVRMRVPDLAPAGGTGLLDGTIRASFSVFGVPTLDPEEFLWSDIPREHDVFSEAAPVTFQKP